MTLREQILALPLYQSIMYDPKAVEHYRDSVLALLSVGPTPTEIEAGARGLYKQECEDAGLGTFDWNRLSLDSQRWYLRRAEAVLRAAEATSCSD